MKKQYIKPEIIIVKESLELPINCSCNDHRWHDKGHKSYIKVTDSQDDFYSEEDDW